MDETGHPASPSDAFSTQPEPCYAYQPCPARPWSNMPGCTVHLWTTWLHARLKHVVAKVVAAGMIMQPDCAVDSRTVNACDGAAHAYAMMVDGTERPCSTLGCQLMFRPCELQPFFRRGAGITAPNPSALRA